MASKRKKIGEVVMMGNEAMARGLLEAGVQCATSYPGTPASEILEAVLRFKKQENVPLFAEWAINEKVAFETALAQSYLGRRAAVSMKQVGLNVAADPLMSAAYIGVKGGFVIIAADDPGPKSSQTEQDSRFQAFFAKIPVFDPSSPWRPRRWFLGPSSFPRNMPFPFCSALRPGSAMPGNQSPSIPCRNRIKRPFLNGIRDAGPPPLTFVICSTGS